MCKNLLKKLVKTFKNQLYFSNERYSYYKAKAEITKGGVLKGKENEDSISATILMINQQYQIFFHFYSLKQALQERP